MKQREPLDRDVGDKTGQLSTLPGYLNFLQERHPSSSVRCGIVVFHRRSAESLTVGANPKGFEGWANEAGSSSTYCATFHVCPTRVGKNLENSHGSRRFSGKMEIRKKPEGGSGTDIPPY